MEPFSSNDSQSTLLLAPRACVISLDDEEFMRKEKQRQREFERRSRKKRRDKIEVMREDVTRLERLQVAIQVASDADAIWDEFLDADTKHLRGLLRRLVPAAQDIRQLLHEKNQLHHLLAEHELATKAMANFMDSAGQLDDWEANTQRWKALARQHFCPLDIVQCAKHINAALLKMDEFTTSRDRQTTGLTFMGWRDSRRLDAASSSLEFSLDKVYRGHNMEHCSDMMWHVFTDEELYSSLVLGGRARVSMDILQVISPTICVLRYDGAYEGLPVIVHELYLLFRIETEGGAIQFLKSIEDADFQNAFSKPNDVWTANNMWVKWDVLDTTRPRSSTDCRVWVGGSMQGANYEYLNRWLFEVLATIMRLEVIGIGRPMLDFS